MHKQLLPVGGESASWRIGRPERPVRLCADATTFAAFSVARVSNVFCHALSAALGNKHSNNNNNEHRSSIAAAVITTTNRTTYVQCQLMMQICNQIEKINII